MLWLGALGLILAVLVLSKINVLIDLYIKKDKNDNVLSIGLWVGSLRFFYKNFITSDDSWEEFILSAMQITTAADHPTIVQGYERTIFTFLKSRLPNPLKISRWWGTISLYSGEYLLNRLSCQRLECSTKIGFLNPALTGVAVGCLWLVEHNLLHRLIQKIGGIRTVPIISIIPDFSRTTLELEFNCIFALRVGHIITAIGRICLLMLCSFVRGEKIEQPSY